MRSSKEIDRKRKAFRLFLVFFKVGSLAFGGPFVILEYLRKELVERHGLISQEDFSTALAVGFTTPGPVAFGAGIYLGYIVEGIPGALMAALGLLATPFALALAFAILYGRLENVKSFSHLSSGLAAGAVGVLASLCIRQGRGNVRNPLGIAVMLSAAVLFLLGFNPVVSILLGCLAGLLRAAYWGKRTHGKEQEEEV